LKPVTNHNHIMVPVSFGFGLRGSSLIFTEVVRVFENGTVWFTDQLRISGFFEHP